MSTAMSTGSVGRPRGIGFGILLFVVTLGFYGWYWAYQTHEEMKQETGDGVGGVIGLVIWILLNFVSVRDPLGGREDVPQERPRVAGDGLDRPVALPGHRPRHPGDRLVRQGAGRAQPLLGGGRRRSQLDPPTRRPAATRRARARSGRPDRRPPGPCAS